MLKTLIIQTTWFNTVSAMASSPSRQWRHYPSTYQLWSNEEESSGQSYNANCFNLPQSFQPPPILCTSRFWWHCTKQIRPDFSFLIPHLSGERDNFGKSFVVMLVVTSLGDSCCCEMSVRGFVNSGKQRPCSCNSINVLIKHHPLAQE